MALIEPGPWEKIINWLKGAGRNTSKLSLRLGPDMVGKRKGPDVIWTRKLNPQTRIEVFAREDGLFSFREMKIVNNGPAAFDIPVYESGLYSDMKEIVLAVSHHIETICQRGQ